MRIITIARRKMIRLMRIENGIGGMGNANGNGNKDTPTKAYRNDNDSG